MKNWKNQEVVCIDVKTKKKWKTGDVIKSFRGHEAIIIELQPPSKVSVGGRIRTTLGTHSCTVYCAAYLTIFEYNKFIRVVRKLSIKYKTVNLSKSTLKSMANNVIKFDQTSEEKKAKKRRSKLI